MPNITQLITELNTIATAQQGLPAFLYADPMDVNAFRDKEYPLLLADRNITIENMGLKTRQRVYVLKLHFFDLYSRTDAATIDAQEKQRDIELVAEEFLQEFRSRYREQNKPWKLENEDAFTGQWGFNKHNDRLIQLTYTLKIRSQGECVAGVFVY
jgi:hypothetical protein